MNVTGIIAEYNPFHNGHAYQIKKARELTHADYIVVILNGDFMQRGVPAILNKYQRAAMALAQGADAVFELPALYGTSSAEFFAYGGIRLLDELGCISNICFGCEHTSLPLLQELAAFLTEEPQAYRIALNQALSEGYSFPRARQAAVLASFPGSHAAAEELNAILNAPNTILALEYLKSLRQLNSTIQPVACLRTDSGYHENTLTGAYSSATAIRTELLANGYSSPLQSCIPDSSLRILQACCQDYGPVAMEDYYPYLQYCLWKPSHPLSEYLDMNTELANRLLSVYTPKLTYSELTAAMVTKSYTRSRILRALLHIMLDIRQEQMDIQRAAGTMHYARLLAFRKESSAFLRQLQKTSHIPVINKVSDGLHRLRLTDSLGASLLEQDISCADLYELGAAKHYRQEPVNEFRAGIIMDASS